MPDANHRARIRQERDKIMPFLRVRVVGDSVHHFGYGGTGERLGSLASVRAAITQPGPRPYVTGGLTGAIVLGPLAFVKVAKGRRKPETIVWWDNGEGPELHHKITGRHLARQAVEEVDRLTAFAAAERARLAREASDAMDARVAEILSRAPQPPEDAESGGQPAG